MTAQLIIFDLDGTLVDSVPDIAFSLNLMLNQVQRPTQDERHISHWVGNGMDRLLHRALTGSMNGQAEVALFEQAKPLFLQAYEQNMNQRSRLYPGVAQGLQQLKQQQLKLACITNKPNQFTQPLLAHLGIAAYFDLVLGAESLPQKKPDPAPLLHACRQLAIGPAYSLMVGDSENDVLAAKRAGIKVIGLTYGYNHGQPLSSAQPDYLMDSFSQLITYLLG